VKAKIKDFGIITKLSPYGDSSQIIQAFCRSHGQISILAKGYRKQQANNPLVQLFEYELSLYEPVEQGLYLLSEASLIRGNTLHEQAQNWVAAELGAELLSKILIASSDAQDYYELLSSYITYLHTPDIKPVCIWWRFFSRILSLSGYELNLDTCELCGNCGEERLILDMRNGGMICVDCAEAITQEDGLMVISSKAAHILKLLPEIGLHMQELKLGRNLAHELNSFFVAAFEGRFNKTLRLKSLSVLEQFYPV